MNTRAPSLLILSFGLLLSIPRTPSFSQAPINEDARLMKLRQYLQQKLGSTLTFRGRELGSTSNIGIAVMEADSGALVYENKGDVPFSAASNAKIITTAAALDLLGPEFNFRTELLTSANGIDAKGVISGDLYLRGRGNPTFHGDDMSQLARRLETQGVTKVRGSIIIDNSYFDAENFPPHFDEQPDETAGFRAPIAATSFAFNSWTLIARPALSGRGPARMAIWPANNYIQLRSSVRTVERGRTSIQMKQVAIDEDSLTVQVSGQIQNRVRMRRFRRLAPNPTLFVGTGLLQALRDSGIRVRKGRIESGRPPDNAQVLVVHESPPLSVMVRAMGKYSNNFSAELLLKVIGAETRAGGQPATWQHGLDAVRDFMSRVGIPPGSYRFGNGSGLFDSNQLTPMQIVKVLQYARQEARWGPDFYASLAIAGADGTLRSRLSNTIAERRIRAKTGTLSHASALSGIAAVDGNHPLLFSILINGFSKNQINTARRIQDEVAIHLIEALDEAPRK